MNYLIDNLWRNRHCIYSFVDQRCKRRAASSLDIMQRSCLQSDCPFFSNNPFMYFELSKKQQENKLNVEPCLKLTTHAYWQLWNLWLQVQNQNIRLPVWNPGKSPSKDTFSIISHNVTVFSVHLLRLWWWSQALQAFVQLSAYVCPWPTSS